MAFPFKIKSKIQISQQKQGRKRKAAGSGEKPAEAIKTDIETAVHIMYLFKKIQVEAKNARGIERMHQEDTRGSKKFQRNGKNASLLNCQRSIIINNFKKHIIYLNNYASISVFKKYKLKNK